MLWMWYHNNIYLQCYRRCFSRRLVDLLCRINIRGTFYAFLVFNQWNAYKNSIGGKCIRYFNQSLMVLYAAMAKGINWRGVQRCNIFNGSVCDAWWESMLNKYIIYSPARNVYEITALVHATKQHNVFVTALLIPADGYNLMLPVASSNTGECKKTEKHAFVGYYCYYMC